jgi:isocitrate/isopropylmalate dehydrogenase
MSAEKKYRIGIMPGDGIGRDVIQAASIVLETVRDLTTEFNVEFTHLAAGEEAFEKYGESYPQVTRDGIAQSNAVLFGSAGGQHNVPVIMGFRMGFDLYANVRPIKALPGSHALRPKADVIIVRENTEGLYRGVGYIDGDYHVDLRVFTTKGMERILRFCFELAVKEGRRKVTFTHKAQVLTHTDAPMREMFREIAKEYPEIEAEDMTIDACAMQLVMRPERLDIVFAENANGDILSDVGAAIVGGMGFAYSGNMGDGPVAIFEPIHGTAPKYAGKNVVNPIAAIMAAKMMFDYLGERATGTSIERAIIEVLLGGKVRTYDIGGTSSTTDVAEAISEKLRKNWLA